MKKKKWKLTPTGHETPFEVAQLVMAALTMEANGEGAAASEVVLQLDPETARMVLWIVLQLFLAGFDEEIEKKQAIQIVAEAVAKEEKMFGVLA